jgi:hypothetical protein
VLRLAGARGPARHPQRFIAFRRPASALQSGEHVFTREWLYSVNVRPQIMQVFAGRVGLCPVDCSWFAWHFVHSTWTSSGFW